MKINLVIILLLSQFKYSLGIVNGRYMFIVLAVLPLLSQEFIQIHVIKKKHDEAIKVIYWVKANMNRFDKV